MISSADFKILINTLADVTEAPHFERTAFKSNSRIFVSLAPDGKSINIKLTPEDQSVFCAFDKSIIYPVPNKWGLQGWTTIDLTKVKKTTLRDALKVAYTTVNLLKKK